MWRRELTAFGRDDGPDEAWLGRKWSTSRCALSLSAALFGAALGWNLAYRGNAHTQARPHKPALPPIASPDVAAPPHRRSEPPLIISPPMTHEQPPPPRPPSAPPPTRHAPAAHLLLRRHIHWRWSGPPSVADSQLGVALAAASDRPGTVVVYGVLGQPARLALMPNSKALAQKMGVAVSSPLKCSLAHAKEASAGQHAAETSPSPFRQQAVRPSAVAQLFEGYARPEFYRMRYGVAHPEARAMRNRTRYKLMPVLTRLECRFTVPPTAPWPPRHALLSLGTREWGLENLPIVPMAALLGRGRDAAAAAATEPPLRPFVHTPPRASALGAQTIASSSNAGASALPTVARAASPVVTVCVNKVYAPGVSTREWMDFLSYYLLLGASRVVIFESIETNGTAAAAGDWTRRPGESSAGSGTSSGRPGADKQWADKQGADKQGADKQADTAPSATDAEEIAEEIAHRRRALSALQGVLGAKLVVVPSFCTHDVMLRATPNMHCQVLAGNLCLDASAAADAPAPALTLHVDPDEFLTPPVRTPDNATSAAATAAAAEPLAGSLARLAALIHARQANLNAPPGDVPTGACLKFASVFYHPPARCADDMSGNEKRKDSRAFGPTHVTAPLTTPLTTPTHAVGDMSTPAILRLTERSSPDSFERGPSSAWRHLISPGSSSRAAVQWDHRVRAKFLMQATPNGVCTRNHRARGSALSLQMICSAAIALCASSARAIRACSARCARLWPPFISHACAAVLTHPRTHPSSHQHNV